jgi:hypothetical protein
VGEKPASLAMAMVWLFHVSSTACPLATIIGSSAVSGFSLSAEINQ